jgi:transposase InsO family protein
VADITYIPTWAGFLYLAVVLDAFSRRIVGWSMATTLHMQVVLDALNMALWQRRPSAVIHHSDHGSQYTSIEFGKRCREAGVRPSMGSVGDAYDNAMAESFFATLECESPSNANMRRSLPNPVHTSMPSCSRLSRSGLEASQQVVPPARRPSLTAARHDGLGVVQAGTKRCSRPNQKIAPKRRTECSQTDTLIPRPDLSTKPGQAHIVRRQVP